MVLDDKIYHKLYYEIFNMELYTFIVYTKLLMLIYILENFIKFAVKILINSVIN